MEEFHESSVVLPLGKYHSTSTIASSRLRLAAVRGAVYPQSCRRERFAARRRLAGRWPATDSEKVREQCARIPSFWKSLAQWSHRTVLRNKSDHLLTGLLFDDAGHRMI